MEWRRGRSSVQKRRRNRITRRGIERGKCEKNAAMTPMKWNRTSLTHFLIFLVCSWELMDVGALELTRNEVCGDSCASSSSRRLRGVARLLREGSRCSCGSKGAMLRVHRSSSARNRRRSHCASRPSQSRSNADDAALLLLLLLLLQREIAAAQSLEPRRIVAAAS
jgi:hypothetical protein